MKVSEVLIRKEDGLRLRIDLIEENYIEGTILGPSPYSNGLTLYQWNGDHQTFRSLFEPSKSMIVQDDLKELLK